MTYPTTSCLLFVLLLLWLMPADPAQAAGETAAEVSQEIAVGLVPDKATIMLGEPVFLSLIVQNHSHQDLQIVESSDYHQGPNGLNQPGSLAIRVMGEDGHLLPEPEASGIGGGILGVKREIPAQRDHTIRLFLPNWVTFAQPGRYSIRLKKTLEFQDYPTIRFFTKEKSFSLPIQVQATVNVIAPDATKMGEIIAVLGNTMLEARSPDSGEATEKLMYIHDDRVIPYFTKDLATDNYDQKIAAVSVLAHFNNKAALQGLAEALATQRKDIGHTTTAVLAQALADNIRLSAADALAASPYPAAKPYLLAVIHTLGQLKAPIALDLLREMTHNKSKIVSDEAKRYLRLKPARQ